MNNPIYLDHAATSPLRREVLDAMMPYLTEHHGNPSSVHGPGRIARNAVEDARAAIAELLHVEPGDIIFTSGGSESDTAVLTGGRPADRPGLATARTEHDAIVRTAERLEELGMPVHWLSVGDDGGVSPEAVEAVLSTDTARIGLVSVMHVNNEIGTVNDIAAISAICRTQDVRLHSDAVQSAGYMDLAALARHVDYLTLSGHKIGGPKGIGLLCAVDEAPIDPLVMGGNQERERRAGTENVAAIVGFAEALRLAAEERADVSNRVRKLTSLLKVKLETSIGNRMAVNTPRDAAPHILNVIVTDGDGRGLDGEMLVLSLDVEGCAVSTGSACSSGTVKPSRVLLEMGHEPDLARGAIRFSLGPSLSKDDIDRAADTVVRVVRRMQPA